MTVPEIKAKLDELGIAYQPSMLKPELEALLPVEGSTEPSANNAPAVNGGAAEGEAPAAQGAGAEGIAEEEDEEDNDTDTSDAVTVFSPAGYPHRTFSREQHGKQFRQVAKTYVSSRPGWKIGKAA